MTGLEKCDVNYTQGLANNKHCKNKVYTFLQIIKR